MKLDECSNLSSILSAQSLKTAQHKDFNVKFNNLLPIFTSQPQGYPLGNVELIVHGITFLAHKDILIFASSFFQDLLTGDWAETTHHTHHHAKNSVSSNQSPTILSSNSIQSSSPKVNHHHHHSSDSNKLNHSSSSNSNILPSKQIKVDARIFLQEEQPAAFQDLLMFIYPNLDCVCTWQNASELMIMARKFDMPLLKRHVLNFLLSSVAGRPIEAMKIAEEHQLPELYRESSRFLLDNWQGWDQNELEILSSETLLKLEKRRTWFLERLLKLGLINTSRDYVCPPTCPDPQYCGKLVDDKWKSAWAASFKFGPPQPSSVYRALRCLEPSLHSPALLLPHTSCQQYAIRFFADLFDRMFSQFTPRGGGSLNLVGNNFNSTTNPTTSNLGGTTNSNPAIETQPGPSHHHTNSNGFGSIGSSTSGVTSITNPLNAYNLTGTSNLTTLNTFSNITSSLMTNISSDKAVRKAKYFLSVELFENSSRS
ncbi:hypothetical protein O181_002069 [Austropuccinia psidii MF-1]|uniref:BTB domain-containing protein n=1 Tax=Austropuccinia psidii MF-1 TaxID=1389203 RepID=A0A9Q3GCH9_9BASI|nr:hypothetical protein [Austropuccinia psidii MF-1]